MQSCSPELGLPQHSLYWPPWCQHCQGPTRSQPECWLWLCADCTQSSTTRWGTLNLLCLAKSWQTEHHCCCQPEKYWKLLNHHNSWSSVAGLQPCRAVGQCQVSHGAVWALSPAWRAQCLLLPNSGGSCRGTFKGKMLWMTLLLSNSCFVCREGSWLRALSLIPFMMLP